MSEPVEYQYRTRPDWIPEWNGWNTCSKESAQAYEKTPYLHDWHYEVRRLYTTPPQRTEQEPVAWKLVPVNPTNEMLKAMDECSTEGYEERLYAGHAASVYMAAVDVAPTPPQRTWVGLTEQEHTDIAVECGCMSADWVFYGAAVERKLKERNT